MSRGLIGGRRVWTIVAFVLWGARMLRRMIVRDEVVVSREVLKPGQRVSVEALSTTVGAAKKTKRRS